MFAKDRFLIVLTLVVILAVSQSKANWVRKRLNPGQCRALHQFIRHNRQDTPPLQFDNVKLNRYAFRRAAELDQNGFLGPPSKRYGENWLLYSTFKRGSDTVCRLLFEFVDRNERFRYNYDIEDPNQQDVATHHFTQMVWKSTTHVACVHYGRALLCAYHPPGNYLGEFKQNVERQQGGFTG